MTWSAPKRRAARRGVLAPAAAWTASRNGCYSSLSASAVARAESSPRAFSCAAAVLVSSVWTAFNSSAATVAASAADARSAARVLRADYSPSVARRSCKRR
eukprot:4539348-Prymnesium_polylepis.1